VCEVSKRNFRACAALLRLLGLYARTLQAWPRVPDTDGQTSKAKVEDLVSSLATGEGLGTPLDVYEADLVLLDERLQNICEPPAGVDPILAAFLKGSLCPTHWIWEIQNVGIQIMKPRNQPHQKAVLKGIRLFHVGAAFEPVMKRVVKRLKVYSDMVAASIPGLPVGFPLFACIYSFQDWLTYSQGHPDHHRFLDDLRQWLAASRDAISHACPEALRLLEEQETDLELSMVNQETAAEIMGVGTRTIRNWNTRNRTRPDGWPGPEPDDRYDRQKLQRCRQDTKNERFFHKIEKRQNTLRKKKETGAANKNNPI